MDSDDHTEAPLPLPTATKHKINPIHLPDDLFTPAFAAKAKAIVAVGKWRVKRRGREEERRTGASSKDVVLGSRTSASSQQPLKHALPPPPNLKRTKVHRARACSRRYIEI
ncbi:hypothetical protein BDQ17DRAFT_1551118 [Cyathus striatus]|nr:hypothetical protein BDQ17DRAFT_1551118 [Cyathus striatus]